MKTDLQNILDSINETVGTFVTNQKSMQTAAGRHRPGKRKIAQSQ